MNALPDPVWPVVVLAIIQIGDAVLCLKPVAFVARCFEDVHWPREHWWIMPPIKLAAATGLIAGIWVPYLAAITIAALIGYFLIAIGMHLMARDLGRNLFLNATGMLLICVATGVHAVLP